MKNQVNKTVCNQETKRKGYVKVEYTIIMKSLQACKAHIHDTASIIELWKLEFAFYIAHSSW